MSDTILIIARFSHHLDAFSKEERYILGTGNNDSASWSCSGTGAVTGSALPNVIVDYSERGGYSSCRVLDWFCSKSGRSWPCFGVGHGGGPSRLIFRPVQPTPPPESFQQLNSK